MFRSLASSGPSATELALGKEGVTLEEVLSAADLATQYRTNNPKLMEYFQKPATQHELIELTRTMSRRELLKYVIGLFQSSNTYLHSLFANNLQLINESTKCIDDSPNGGYGIGLISRFLARAFDLWPAEVSEILRLGDHTYSALLRNLNRSVIYQAITDLINPVYKGIHVFCWNMFLVLTLELPEECQNIIRQQYLTIKTIGERDLFDEIKDMKFTDEHKFNISELLKMYFHIPKNDWVDDDARIHFQVFEKAFNFFMINIPDAKFHPKYYEVAAEFQEYNFDLGKRAIKDIKNKETQEENQQLVETALTYLSHLISKNVSGDAVFAEKEYLFSESVKIIRNILINQKCTCFVLDGCTKLVASLIEQNSKISQKYLPQILIRAHHCIKERNEVHQKQPFVYLMAFMLKDCQQFGSKKNEIVKWETGKELTADKINEEVLPIYDQSLDENEDFEYINLENPTEANINSDKIDFRPNNDEITNICNSSLETDEPI